MSKNKSKQTAKPSQTSSASKPSEPKQNEEQNSTESQPTPTTDEATSGEGTDPEATNPDADTSGQPQDGSEASQEGEQDQGGDQGQSDDDKPADGESGGSPTTTNVEDDADNTQVTKGYDVGVLLRRDDIEGPVLKSGLYEPPANHARPVDDNTAKIAWKGLPEEGAPEGKIIEPGGKVTFDGDRVGNMVVVKEDVYQKFYPRGSRRPSYSLLYRKGTTVPATSVQSQG